MQRLKLSLPKLPTLRILTSHQPIPLISIKIHLFKIKGAYESK